MANVSGVSQLMETVGVPAAQTTPTSSAPAQSFATVMHQANDDAGVPAAPVQQSAPQKAGTQRDDKRQGADHATTDASSAAATPETATVAVKPQPVVAPHVHSSHYTSANLLMALLTPSDEENGATVGQNGTGPVSAASSKANTLSATTNAAAPLSVQAGQAPAVAEQQVPAISPQPVPPLAVVATTESPVVAKLPSASATLPSTDGKTSLKASAANPRATTKSEAAPREASSAQIAPTWQTTTSAPITVQVATNTAPTPPIADKVPVSAVQSPAIATSSTVPSAVGMTSASSRLATAAPPQTLEPNASARDLPSTTATATERAQPAGMPPSFQPAATASAVPSVSTQDAAKFTATITASPDAHLPDPTLAPSTRTSSAPQTGVGLPVSPDASAAAAKTSLQAINLNATAPQPGAEAQPAMSTTPPAATQQPLPANAPAVRQTDAQPTQTMVQAAAPGSSLQKVNGKPSLSVDAAAGSTPVPPQAAGAVQPSASSSDTKDSKDTSHPAARITQAVPQVSPAPIMEAASTAGIPIAIAHTPVALTTLSTPGGPKLSDATTIAAASSNAGDTVPHTTLTSTPTTLEVGVSSGTHGWLKIRAELNASGTVDASLTGANAAATGKLHTDLPALSSFLQDEKVVLGSLNVAAPSGTVSAVHATVGATLEPVSAFTRSAAEAVGATGTAVASDAGTSGGRAPQQEAQPSHPSLSNAREEDGLLGAVTAPAVYGDINDLGNTGALASGGYNGGGSWLNVRV